MGDRIESIVAAAARWADAREDGTHIDAMRALDRFQRTIAEEIAAAVAAERARVIAAARQLAGELGCHDRATVGYVISCLEQSDAATPAPTPVAATPADGWDAAEWGAAARTATAPATPADEAGVDLPVSLWNAARDYGVTDDQYNHGGATRDHLMIAQDAFEREVAAYIRARAASAVPECVIDAVRKRRDALLRTLGDWLAIADERYPAWREEAHALDAWLRAVAGAEGVQDA